LLRLFAGLMCALIAFGTGEAAPARGPCEGPDVDAWVTRHRDRVIAEDALFAFASATFGGPLSCEGDVFEFDGRPYGGVVLTLADAVTFASMTQPPMAVVVWIESPSGFPDPAAARDALRRYAREHGLAIDWDVVEVDEDGAWRTERFWDPDAGLNGSVMLGFDGSSLVEVGLSLAP